MEEITISIKRSSNSYGVYIGKSMLSRVKGHIEKNHHGKNTVIIIDDAIKKVYGKKINEEFSDISRYSISLPGKESTKSRETKSKVEDLLLERGYGRDTLIVAIGGGVIGDLSGFVASTFNRGIPIIHLPTTLLAMVDSSIGGKTSVNTRHGKNLIGAIWQPDAVFADLDFLGSLPDSELLNGMAEAVKMAISHDRELFLFMEKNAERALSRDDDALMHIIRRSIELKKSIVEKDERESGLRQALNLGHTIGHALEAYSGYKPRHGLCVSMGIAAENRISGLLGILRESDEKRILSLLDRIGLPTKIKKGIDPDRLIRIMASDKKSVGQKPRFVMLNEIGSLKSDGRSYSFEAEDSIIREAIRAVQR